LKDLIDFGVCHNLTIPLLYLNKLSVKSLTS